MEIKDIFDSYGRSTWHVLCESGVGYYIPSYQREYTWGKENIQRLFEDTIHGIRLLVDSDDSITFIGTIITIHDSKCQTIDPIVKSQMPKTVYLIIDGQQRMVTLLLLNTILHQQIRLEANRFKTETGPEFSWLCNTALEVCSQLETTYQLDMVYGEGHLKWYPRMIRSLEDSWSREAKTVKYNSPIARYLHGYSSFVRDNPTKAYRYETPEGAPVHVAGHKIIKDNSTFIARTIMKICKRRDSETELPEISKIINSKAIQETLFKNELSDEVKSVLYDISGAKKIEDYKSLFNVILMAKYILERMAVTVVTAKNEDYAFDMFEALNTTGEPLTAFETFKPKVIQSEGLNNFEASKSRAYLNSLEDYLKIYTKAQEKHKATSNLLIPFALAESGSKLSKRLSEQRRYLKEHFDAFKTLEEKRAFTCHLASLAVFMKNSWPDRSDDPPSILGEDSAHVSQALMCLDVLRASNHYITISPIARFYALYRNSSDNDKPASLIELKKAIMAITAFSILWRASRRGTDQIDSYYRKLMESGFDEIGIPPFARLPKDKPLVKPTSVKLKVALRHVLSVYGKISSKEDWVAKVWSLPIYEINGAICRFLLLAATHDASPDNDNPGLVKATSGYIDLLNFGKWLKKEDLTAEHIAPQAKPNSGWDEQLYNDSDTVHCLGNLTLLTRVQNSVAGNLPWEKKKLIYKLLSAESQEEHVQLIADAKKCGIEINETSEKILIESDYSHMVTAIGKTQAGWTCEHIEKRSKRMAEIIWDRLYPWLCDAHE